MWFWWTAWAILLSTHELKFNYWNCKRVIYSVFFYIPNWIKLNRIFCVCFSLHFYYDLCPASIWLAFSTCEHVCMPFLRRRNLNTNGHLSNKMFGSRCRLGWCRFTMSTGWQWGESIFETNTNRWMAYGTRNRYTEHAHCTMQFRPLSLSFFISLDFAHSFTHSLSFNRIDWAFCHSLYGFSIYFRIGL